MKKVMIVDDSSTMRKIILRALHRGGLHIETTLEAANGVEAMEHLSAHDDIALVVTDVNMPDMHGIEFLRRARRSYTAEQLAIVVVTAEGGEVCRAEAIEAGANDYLTKPFTPESIVVALAPYFA